MDAFSLCIDRSTAIGGQAPSHMWNAFPCGRGGATIRLAPDGLTTVLQMQCVPQRPQRGFLYGFAEGRVGVDGARHVFQA